MPRAVRALWTLRGFGSFPLAQRLEPPMHARDIGCGGDGTVQTMVAAAPWPAGSSTAGQHAKTLIRRDGGRTWRSCVSKLACIASSNGAISSRTARRTAASISGARFAVARGVSGLLVAALERRFPRGLLAAGERGCAHRCGSGCCSIPPRSSLGTSAISLLERFVDRCGLRDAVTYGSVRGGQPATRADSTSAPWKCFKPRRRQVDVSPWHGSQRVCMQRHA